MVQESIINYRKWENFGEGKIGEYMANHELFAKFFLANIHRYTENVTIWHMH